MFGLVLATVGLAGVTTHAVTRRRKEMGVRIARARARQVLRLVLSESIVLVAVGCVAFWLLTGRPVFQGSTVMEAVTQHARDAPPSRWTELPIPPGVDAVSFRCLAKRPEGRPQSADELAHILADACDVRTWTEAHARDWWELRSEEGRG